ncbi:MAG: aminomethyl-transferring glycine dehydrogenase subunit GcvPB, partial [Thermodesulfobacteriota bacterium]
MKEHLLIFEKSRKGRHGVLPAPTDVPCVKPSDAIPRAFLRKDIAGFPEVSEADCVRHYTTLSQKNVGVDSVFYPLGSCTMKYNPKINEVAARLTGFTELHPYEDETMAQGALELMFGLERALAEISGMSAITLQP